MLTKLKYSTLILIVLVLLCDSSFVLAENPKAPNTLKEAETMGKEILWGLPKALKEPWNQALQLWSKIGDWLLKWLNIIWQKICSLLDKKVEKKKIEVQEEFEKEKQEMKEEIPKASKSLWKRFKELID